MTASILKMALGKMEGTFTAMTYHQQLHYAMGMLFTLSGELKAQGRELMLNRKIYQLCCDGREVWIYLRDQQRWIERARILDIEGDLVTVRYELDEDDEICSWEEMIRLESIGSIQQKLAAVPKGDVEPMVSEDCPEAEQLGNPHSDGSDS